MIEITVDSVFETAVKVVKGREGYVYTSPLGNKAGIGAAIICSYVHGDRPGCIVGNILHEMGVDLVDMKEHEGDDAIGLLKGLRGFGIVSTTIAAERALQWMQGLQDNGSTWGEAVSKAKASISE